MATERYKISNTTVKPRTVDSQGRDTRKICDRVGHMVMIKEKPGDDGKTVMIPATRFAVVDYLDQGIMDLESQGIVKIEIVKDMGSVLETFRQQRPAARPATAQDDSRVRASEMGNASKAPSGEYEGAVNPDGAPNFVVKAPHIGGLTSKESDGPSVS